LYGNAKKLNDLFLVQRVSILLQEIYSKWSFLHQWSLTNSRWAWQSCYLKSNIISTKDGFRRDHPLQQSCFGAIIDKKIIKFIFRAISIWPFNPKAMDNKT
jgi:hypothetical protein